ncbi:myb-like protein P isoform X2 [Harmonia axyridis]|uniref:myb-like protein P isoform X2 n=1 Tax=Harmonia axyridis TaxID=115357 RepID=UPI001E277062|nr:myb-like protein P isoform X2 [Harmonia axyridis]
MSDLDSLMTRVIGQIYSVLAHESKMGLWDGHDESDGVYSFQFLQSLHKDFMVNLHKLLEMTNFKFDDGKDQDKNILTRYLAIMNAKKSKYTHTWLTLRHFMIYVYRSLLSLTPQSNIEELSKPFIAEMKDMVKQLSGADEIQLYLKVYSLLHQFVCFISFNFYHLIDEGSILGRLYQYYQKFLIASKSIYPVFMDLEKLLRDRCNMTWMDYNKFIFFNVFYRVIDSEIFAKLKQKDKLEVLAEYNSMIIDFGELNALWQTLKNFRGVNQNMPNDKSEDHKRILETNYWVFRDKTEDSIQSLAAELIILASNRSTRGCPSFFSSGQCLCEDCLLSMITLQINSKKIAPPFLLLQCRFCPRGVDLNQYHDHTVEHIRRNRPANAFDSPVRTNDSFVLTGLLTDMDNSNIYKKLDDKENREGKNGEKGSQSLLSLLKKVKPSVSKTDTKVEHFGNRPIEKKAENIANGEIKENCRVPYIRNETTNKNSSSCSHSCKHEEELKAELKKLQGVCDHHKDSKRCDSTYCEVFGSTVAPNKKHTNETRTRLRIRLNQRNQKQKSVPVDPTNRIPTTKNVIPTKTSPPKFEPTVQLENHNNLKTSTIIKPSLKPVDIGSKDLKTTAEPMRNSLIPRANEHKLNDIHGLVDYIEGNSGSDKAAIAEKKAAKKARQRQRKEEERKEIEDKRIKEEEDKKKEAEKQLRLKQQLERERNSVNEVSKKSKKLKNKNKGNTNVENDVVASKLIEETIPAMVTIKKSMENGDNSPTVTITLKGTTPDQDKLLYTLMNDQSDINKEKGSNKSKKNKKPTNVQQKVEHLVKVQVLRKEYNSNNNGKTNNSVDKEVKVSFTVNNKNNETCSGNKNNDSDKNKAQFKIENTKSKEVDLPFLKLPPGITITKIDGPSSNNRNNYQIAMNDPPGNSNVPVNNKSGVIVVDTEKLINSNENNKETSRKSRKKKNKKQPPPSPAPAVSSQPSMVTLKNPIFQSLSESVGRQHPMPLNIAGASCGQASIFRNENGMVTIRSSRLQQSINNGIPMHNLLSDLKPVIGGEVESPVVNTNSVSRQENSMTSKNAQEILSGLPGIEITKVDKKSHKTEQDSKAKQIAQVSIIPTNGDKYNLDKDDWSYDNIFSPKDVLEDDLDAEERELEAFKRFCQQSIPPKQKEKVAHLNVQDIILKKKNDVNFA